MRLWSSSASVVSKETASPGDPEWSLFEEFWILRFSFVVLFELIFLSTVSSTSQINSDLEKLKWRGWWFAVKLPNNWARCHCHGNRLKLMVVEYKEEYSNRIIFLWLLSSLMRGIHVVVSECVSFKIRWSYISPTMGKCALLQQQRGQQKRVKTVKINM